MKNWKILSLIMFFVFVLNLVTTGSNLVSADGDFDEEYANYGKEGDGDEGYEDIGEMAGWITVMAMGTAGLIFPIRRSMKWMITSYPRVKNNVVAISKFLGKYHILFGVIALALSIFHGVVMFLGEGEIEREGIIGLGAAVLMLIGSIPGAVLFKNKKKKSLRTTHRTLIAIALLLGVFHIFIS